MTDIVKAAIKLIDCVEFDMNGAGGKGGNGGLLSDTTLRAAHDLRVIMSREAEREQKARSQRPDPHAFPIFDCPQLPAPSVAVKALEPFAKEADRWEPRGEAHWLDSTPFPANSISTLNIGHLRAARFALSAQVQDVPGIVALADAAYDLASWASCINWRGGENQKEWLDELRQHIERVQSICKLHRATAPANQEGGG